MFYEHVVFLFPAPLCRIIDQILNNDICPIVLLTSNFHTWTFDTLFKLLDFILGHLFADKGLNPFSSVINISFPVDNVYE